MDRTQDYRMEGKVVGAAPKVPGAGANRYRSRLPIALLSPNTNTGARNTRNFGHPGEGRGPKEEERRGNSGKRVSGRPCGGTQLSLGGHPAAPR